MSEQIVKYSVSNRIAWITLNRPEKRNALDDHMVEALSGNLDLALEDEAVKVIVLAAEGKAFCAGADLEYLKKLQSNSYEENLADSRQLMNLFRKIYTCNKVVIGAIQGHAIAGGAGLAAVCDFTFTVPEARFGYSEVRIGFVPAIVSFFLLRKIGEGRAKHLLLSAEIITAKQAVEFGMVNQTVDKDHLIEKVTEFASDLCNNNSAASMALTKNLIGKVQHLSIDEGLELAAKTNAEARGTEDCRKGISAFLNKEDINW